MQETKGNKDPEASNGEGDTKAAGGDNAMPTDQRGRFSRPFAYGAIFMAHFLGAVSLLAWMVFLFSGSLDLVDLGLGEAGALGVNACLCLLFFLQHSLMIRKSIRQWLARFVGEAYLGALYTITAGMALLILVVLWQGSDRVLADPQGLVRWLMRAVFFLSLIGFNWGLRALKAFDMIGTAPLFRYLRGLDSPAPMPFTVRGPYCWVRHPLYLFCLLLIWSGPEVTTDRLLYNILWTVWIVFASMLEERDLIACFGDEYRRYQAQVPMLFPRSIRPARQE